MRFSTIIIFSIFLAPGMFAQTTYDVKPKDGKAVLVETTGKDVRETPIDSRDLEKQYNEADASLKALTTRRAQIAELMRLDEEIAALAGQKNLIADLFKKTQAIEKTIAETKPEALKEEKKGGG